MENNSYTNTKSSKIKIELSHDALAKKIYEKASTEDKMRLRVKQLIKNRYLHYVDTGALLIKSDITYILPFYNSIQPSLSKEEQRFVQRSRIMSFKQSIFIAIVTIITIGILLFSLLSSWNVRRKLKKANRELDSAKNSLEKSLLTITRKDSIARVLYQSNTNKDTLLKISKVDLEIAYGKNLVLLDSLNIINHQLDSINQVLDKSNKRLQKTQVRLEASLVRVKKEKEAAESNTIDLSNRVNKLNDSQHLSQKAQSLIVKEQFSGQDKKLAYQLACAALDIDAENSQAMDVLSELRYQDKIHSGDFASKHYPRRTYNKRSIKAIRRQFKRYGSLSKKQIDYYLKH